MLPLLRKSNLFSAISSKIKKFNQNVKITKIFLFFFILKIRWKLSNIRFEIKAKTKPEIKEVKPKRTLNLSNFFNFFFLKKRGKNYTIENPSLLV